MARIVFLCSPYRGDVDRNVEYARRAARSCLMCGETPIVPHLMYPGALDDANPFERQAGMSAGIDLLLLCDAVVVFEDHGISEGMTYEIMRARAAGIVVERRRCPPE